MESRARGAIRLFTRMGDETVLTSNNGLPTHQCFTDCERFLRAAAQRFATVRDPGSEPVGGSGAICIKSLTACVEPEFEEPDFRHCQ